MISILCPVYNENLTIGRFISEIENTFSSLSYDLEIIFVNDGSTDNTLNILKEYKHKHSFIKIISLSRNFGKEAALTAALDYAQGDAVIPMDVDLQDPPSLIPLLLEGWKKGYEVVLAKRVNRESDSLTKRSFASLFYKIHNFLSHDKIPENVGDFRLMSRKVVESLKRLPENERFMKGLFAWVGFKHTSIEYTRPPRSLGNSKFNFWKLWNLALDGVTSFSTAPLKIWSYVGATISLASLIYGTYIAILATMDKITVPGYASTFLAVLFLGGIQLIGIGVLGEYIGRIYKESKQRPIYIVEEEL